jgi:hypothetical protein
MKSKTLQFIITGIILFLFIQPGTAQIKKDFTGNWTFEAPSAPDGYTLGLISFKKDSAIMSFAGANYTFPASWVKAEGDSLKFETYIDGTTVLTLLKLSDEKKLTGKAVWEGGETQMILTKKEE